MTEIALRPAHGGNLAWAARLAGCSPADLWDFSASINPWGPPQSAIAAIQGNLQGLRVYPDPEYGSLRRAIGQWHDLPPDWILPGNGAAELLTWVGWDLAQRGITYLPTPAFGDYKRALRAFSATVQECSLLKAGELHFSLPSLLSDVSSRGGLLLNNPHNPTGHLWRVGEIVPLLDKFDLVVVDEAFMDFLDPLEEESLLGYIRDFANLVILRSLTKFYSLPGLRLGYAIASPDRLQRWQKMRDPWAVNALAAAVGEVVLRDTIFQQQTRDWLLSARQFLFSSLQKISGLQPLPGAANFLLVRTQFSSSQLQLQLLKEHRILIRDCLSFPELGDRYFRIAVRSPEENQYLINALNNLEIN